MKDNKFFLPGWSLICQVYTLVSFSTNWWSFTKLTR